MSEVGSTATGSTALRPLRLALPAAPMQVAMPTNTMRDRVNSTIEQQPDVAARVVRAWLKEA